MDTVELTFLNILIGEAVVALPVIMLCLIRIAQNTNKDKE